MNLFKRLQGVFFEPKRVFDGLAEKPVWIDALVVVLVALIAFNLIVAPYMQKDQLQLMKDNAALKERMGEEAYTKMIERTEHPSASFRIVQTFVSTPLFYLAALLLQSLLLLILGRLLSTQGTYVQVLAALVHASFIDKLLGNGVRLVLALTRKSAHADLDRPGPALPEAGGHVDGLHHAEPRSISSSSGCSASWPSAWRRSSRSASRRPGPVLRDVVPQGPGQHRHRPHRHELPALTGIFEATSLAASRGQPGV